MHTNCSKLNSPECPCGHNCTDINHYLLHCPLFLQDSEVMFAGLSSVCDLNISCNIHLYGSEMLDYQSNCKVFNVLHRYIESTERL